MILDKLRIIPYARERGSFNMAADNYLLSSEQPALRFYGWEPACLSFGKSRPSLGDINQEYCKKNGYELVLRPSGGKTVFHHLELTYSLFFPLKPMGTILQSYKQISAALIAALKLPNLSMKAEKLTHAGSSNCFLEQSSWEITHNNKKFIGSAQTRKQNFGLQHGSIILDIKTDAWLNIWQGGNDTILKRITSYTEISSRQPDIPKICTQIASSFAEMLCLEPVDSAFTEGERHKIEQEQRKWVLHYDP